MRILCGSPFGRATRIRGTRPPGGGQQKASTRCGCAYPESIAIWIDKVNFTTPRLDQDIDSEFSGNRVDVIDPQVYESVGCCVAGVFREEQTGFTASGDRSEQR